jgi:LysM repeat protein
LDYTVRPGDTLYSIAQRHNVSPQALAQANNLTSPLLFVGQIIRIPVPGPGPGPGFPGSDLNRRVTRLEREVNNLERRVRRLEQGRYYY